MKNPGLDLISVKIFSFLDSTDLVQCVQVSKALKDCTDRNRDFWARKLKKFRMLHASIMNRTGQSALKIIFQYFEDQENPCKIQWLLEVMKDKNVNWTEKMNKSFIWNSCPTAIVEPIDSDGSTMLHSTFVNGSLDQLKLILDILKANDINANPLDNDGFTPLSVSILPNLSESLRFGSGMGRLKMEFLCENIEKYQIDFNVGWWRSYRSESNLSSFEVLCVILIRHQLVQLILKNDVSRRVKMPRTGLVQSLKDLVLNGSSVHFATKVIDLLEEYSVFYK